MQSTKYIPEKILMNLLPKKSGRNGTGQVTSRHTGGREKRFYRTIDFRRDKLDVAGTVISIEYDPNRSTEIALINYTDGEKRYILHPVGLKIGDTVISGKSVEAKVGNSLSLKNIPIGTPIHNIELHAGHGGQLIRGAGTMASILAKDDSWAQVKLPSGEVRKISEECFATVGQLGNIERKATPIGKAGKSRHMGRRPKVRGTAQDPRSHPHGGGEGRSGEGMKQPKTPWGKPARGLKTRNRKKYSNHLILQKRK